MEEKDTKVQEEKTTPKRRTATKTNATKATEPKESEALKKQLEQSEKEKQQMMEMMKNLQDQIDSMKTQQPQIVIPREGENDREIEIGCRLLCGAVLVSPNGDFELRLRCGEEAEVSIREMQSVLRSRFGFKRFFEKGVLYFVDPEMYSYFKIRNPIDLSEDTLIEHLLDDDYNDMVSYLAQVTNNKREDMICHTINYNTALLYKDGKLEDWSYANRSNYEKYMGVKVDDILEKINLIMDKTDLI